MWYELEQIHTLYCVIDEVKLFESFSRCQKERPPGRVVFPFGIPGRIRTGAVSENVPVARFPRDPACPGGQVESFSHYHGKTDAFQGARFFHAWVP